jgi:hypothetical protein
LLILIRLPRLQRSRHFPDASPAIPPRAPCIQTSRRAWIPSPPAEPTELILWLNQVTRWFYGDPPQTHVQTPVVSHYLALAHFHDFVLLFLPPCVSHLTPSGHRVHQAKPTCLCTPWRPHKAKPFAPALHVHQRKSSRNLHLKYSVRSQSTPRCQYLIIPESDHPPVLGRSGPSRIRACLKSEMCIFYL